MFSFLPPSTYTEANRTLAGGTRLAHRREVSIWRRPDQDVNLKRDLNNLLYSGWERKGKGQGEGPRARPGSRGRSRRRGRQGEAPLDVEVSDYYSMVEGEEEEGNGSSDDGILEGKAWHILDAY